MSKRVFYWDTSALLALVFQESHTKSVRSFLESESALPGHTSFFSVVEMESALHRRVAENSLIGELTEVRLQMKRLEAGLSLIWVAQDMLASCRKSIMEYGLRPGDALQLASALALTADHDLVLVSLDDRLNKAARASQLSCAF